MVPTIRQVIKCYQEIAKAERMKCGRPGEMTTKNAVRGANIVCATAGIPIGASVERLTRKAIDCALIKFLEQGIARISAWSYVCQLRAVFAKWTRAYYEDRGWQMPKLELPSFRAQTPRYVRPTPDMLRNVKLWYKNLEREAFEEETKEGARREIRGKRKRLAGREKERMWLAVTLMFEFAMRNGDVLRIGPENFTVVGQRTEEVGEEAHFGEMRARAGGGGVSHYLAYTPHKTELSSGRRVCWPIHPAIWEKLGPLVTDGDLPGSALVRTIDSGVFEWINREMRLLGFRGGKGAYELRKICIDHIYQKFGAEKATAISGDDIKTVTRYYADPSAVTVTGVRIIDLL